MGRPVSGAGTGRWMRYVPIEGLRLVDGCGIFLLRACDWTGGYRCCTPPPCTRLWASAGRRPRAPSLSRRCSGTRCGKRETLLLLLGQTPQYMLPLLL
eukprot:940158-Prorocentrum_minimum.AAC.1